MSKNYLKLDLLRRECVLKSAGVSQEDLSRDVNIFREWARKQKHLPQDYIRDDLFIERLLLNNKFRIEQSKVKYDNYLTSRGTHKIFYTDMWRLKPSEIPVVRIPLMNLTTEGHWIVLICAQDIVNHNSDLVDCVKFHTLVTEVMNKYCYSEGKIIVIDFKGLKSSTFKNFDISILHQHLKIMKTSFSGRTPAFHIINMSNWSNILLTGVKLIFKGETTKIKVHDSMESLYQFIPQKNLPKDYGGESISVKEYLEIWDDIVREEESFLKELETILPDERFRPEELKSHMDIFGVQGTFKKLNID